MERPPPVERGAVLKQAVDALLALAGRADPALVAEPGRTRAEARRELTRAIDVLRHTREQAMQLPAGRRGSPLRSGSSRRSPRGTPRWCRLRDTSRRPWRPAARWC
nr:aldehyde dehydrogenase family protein [Amycolatopsis sp. FDAARGOS 1241]